ncbi:MAG: hypothetical protein K2Q10_12070, partial [Rhodospirillales bacterium]|nr:hypothetical protein [Rhodospirillales bacterium]
MKTKLLAALILATPLYPAAVPAGEPTGEPAAGMPESSADIWRKIRNGEDGYVSNAQLSGQLIKSGCTEQVLGFTAPLHAAMPGITTPGGKGLSEDALLLAAGVFGAAFG